MSTILLTGCNGFIGYNLCKRLSRDFHLIGADDNSKNDYISLQRKITNPVHEFYSCSVLDRDSLRKIFERSDITLVIHLAAKTGVRESFNQKSEYFSTNVLGFCNVLDTMLEFGVKDFVYASSSSVYGDNFGRDEGSELSPNSMYAVTKEVDEIFAEMYSRKFGLNCVGLRFFTVYGEYGRYDMSPLIWAKQLLNNEHVQINGYGNVYRDYTYIGDVVTAIERLVNDGFEGNHLYNIGSGFSVNTIDFARCLAENLGTDLKLTFADLPIADAQRTYAITKSYEDTYGELPHTMICDGIPKLVKWLRDEGGCFHDIISKED